MLISLIGRKPQTAAKRILLLWLKKKDKMHQVLAIYKNTVPSDGSKII